MQDHVVEEQLVFSPGDLIRKCLNSKPMVVLTRIDDFNIDMIDIKIEGDAYEPGQSSKSKHICTRCKVNFGCERSMLEHRKKVHGINFYRCSNCPEIFIHYSTRDKHISDKHGDSYYYIFCNVGNCKRKFKSETPVKLIEFHKFSHTLPKFEYYWSRKTCPVCKKIFKRGSSLRQHINLNHKPEYDAGLGCTTCGQKFRYKDKLRIHEKKHLGVKIPCLHCDSSFSENRILNWHMKNLHGDYKCEYLDCGSKFEILTEFERHKAEEHGVKHTCPHCNVDFAVKITLYKHIRDKHKQLSCEFEGCNETYGTEEELGKHQQGAHDPEIKPGFSCSVCEATFWSKTQHRVHIRRHNPKWKCSFEGCTKAFNSLRDLSLHKKSHESNAVHLEEGEEKAVSGDRKFGCGECGAVFSLLWKFEGHMETFHLNPQEFSCDEVGCGGKFKSQHGLKNHMTLKHPENNPYKCEHCGSSYPTLKALKNHIRRVHKKEENLQFKCQHCGDSFAYFNVLSKHIQKNHL